MRNTTWKKLALALLSGSVMFQIPACTQTAIGISTFASLVTAGGVAYLVFRVTE